MTPWAAKWADCCDDPHWRSTLVPTTDSGKPAARAALRAMFRPCSPVCMTQPMITSSTSSGSRSLRCTRALSVSAARSTGCQSFSFPLRFPPAVRMASTMTAVPMVRAPSRVSGRTRPVGQDSSTRVQRCATARRVRSFRPVKDMDRWLGDGGMPVIEAVGGSFESYGCGEDGRGWVAATWVPTALACNPHGIVQAGVHSVLLDAAMNFAVNTELEGRDRTRATLEMKTETMRVAKAGEALRVEGRVVRMARQVAYAEATARDESGQLVSRSTGTFLLQREE